MGHDGGVALLRFQKGATGAEVPFHNSILCNFSGLSGSTTKNL